MKNSWGSETAFPRYLRSCSCMWPCPSIEFELELWAVASLSDRNQLVRVFLRVIWVTPFICKTGNHQYIREISERYPVCARQDKTNNRIGCQDSNLCHPFHSCTKIVNAPPECWVIMYCINLYKKRRGCLETNIKMERGSGVGLKWGWCFRGPSECWVIICKYLQDMPSLRSGAESCQTALRSLMRLNNYIIRWLLKARGRRWTKGARWQSWWQRVKIDSGD
jgi:hypothetical protein